MKWLTRAEGFLRGIGLIKNFAPIVYIVAHGSSSANNPHHGAHDCGACSGRPGATNARVQAFILNHKKVREGSAQKVSVYQRPPSLSAACMIRPQM